MTNVAIISARRICTICEKLDVKEREINPKTIAITYANSTVSKPLVFIVIYKCF